MLVINVFDREIRFAPCAASLLADTPAQGVSSCSLIPQESQKLAITKIEQSPT